MQHACTMHGSAFFKCPALMLLKCHSSTPLGRSAAEGLCRSRLAVLPTGVHGRSEGSQVPALDALQCCAASMPSNGNTNIAFVIKLRDDLDDACSLEMDVVEWSDDGGPLMERRGLRTVEQLHLISVGSAQSPPLDAGLGWVPQLHPPLVCGKVARGGVAWPRLWSITAVAHALRSEVFG
jgi:hypothetical protein